MAAEVVEVFIPGSVAVRSDGSSIGARYVPVGTARRRMLASTPREMTTGRLRYQKLSMSIGPQKVRNMTDRRTYSPVEVGIGSSAEVTRAPMTYAVLTITEQAAMAPTVDQINRRSDGLAK
ncbi:hypothetical protein NM962_13865 [Mycobacterium sp. SVM_VP21]|nr:hypothetical protein NM962_13865 [Mycobacterium sp. SVM_VP21]